MTEASTGTRRSWVGVVTRRPRGGEGREKEGNAGEPGGA
jgi:hypothetical protein